MLNFLRSALGQLGTLLFGRAIFKILLSITFFLALPQPFLRYRSVDKPLALNEFYFEILTKGLIFFSVIYLFVCLLFSWYAQIEGKTGEKRKRYLRIVVLIPAIVFTFLLVLNSTIYVFHDGGVIRLWGNYCDAQNKEHRCGSSPLCQMKTNDCPSGCFGSCEPTMDRHEWMNDFFRFPQKTFVYHAQAIFDKMYPSKTDFSCRNAREKNTTFHEFFYKISGHLCYEGKRMWGVDMDTLEIIADNYAKDKKNVYVFGTEGVNMNKYGVDFRLIKGADPRTFKILSREITMDDNAVFLCGDTFESADPKTFMLSGRTLAGDANDVYEINLAINHPFYVSQIPRCWLSELDDHLKKIKKHILDRAVILGEIVTPVQRVDFLSAKDRKRMPIMKKMLAAINGGRRKEQCRIVGVGKEPIPECDGEGVGDFDGAIELGTDNGLYDCTNQSIGYIELFNLSSTGYSVCRGTFNGNTQTYLISNTPASNGRSGDCQIPGALDPAMCVSG